MNEEITTKWPKYAVYTLISIVILLLALIVILYSIRSPLIFRSSAYSPTSPVTQPDDAQSLSLENSYVFASPLRAKTGGEKIRITVFVLDNRGLGMSGKKVVVGGGNLLQVTAIQPVTDPQGRATFDISSGSSTGVYIIQASVDGVTLVQQTTITFD